MTHKLCLFVCFILLITTSLAQTVINGSTIDAASKDLLAYVNIGIKNKNVGTSSLKNGTFVLAIPEANKNDTLTFSLVGYTEVNLAVIDIITTNLKSIPLTQKSIELDAVTINANALIEKKFGIKNEDALVHFTDGSTNQNDIFEIAQLVRFDTILSKVTSLNLLINQVRNDSATFRINFYRYDINGPGERIIDKSIVQIKAITPGWLRFDLSDYGIHMKGDFVVAIEFIPSTQKTDPIYYEIKLGGSAKSFVRTSSQGIWKRPPHHYKMYVTALVEGGKRNKYQKIEIDDDMESVPAIELFSKSVNDTYSIFVQLPEHYNSERKKNYSVVYLLDANAYFDAVADEIRKHRKEVILVGIGYGNVYLMDSLRNRDYTFPPASVEDSFPNSGGGKQFLTFVASELLPFIDRTYHTDSSQRTLMGHSLGGYFTVFAMEQALTDQRSLFYNYVSASPSLYYGNQYLLKTLLDMTEKNINPQKLLLTIGAIELKEDKSIPEYFNSFINAMSDKGYESIELTTEVFQALGHMDTAMPTFVKAIQEIK